MKQTINGGAVIGRPPISRPSQDKQSTTNLKGFGPKKCIFHPLPNPMRISSVAVFPDIDLDFESSQNVSAAAVNFQPGRSAAVVSTSDVVPNEMQKFDSFLSVGEF